MYDTAVFDMDGTLLDTLEDLAGSVNYVMGQLGCPEKTLDQVRMSVGNGAGKLIERTLPGGRDNPEYENALRMFGEYYRGHCQIRTRAYDGILPVLHELKEQGVKMAIVSNKGGSAVKELNRLYFSDVISIAVGERPGIRRKPAPDTVLEAMRQLGADPERTIYVGDSEVDAATAENAGISCILVSWGFRGREALEKLVPEDHVIDHAGELPAFFL